MKRGAFCKRCGQPLVFTLDAIKRPRSRCPVCDGVAVRAPSKVRLSADEPAPRVSHMVTESEE